MDIPIFYFYISTTIWCLGPARRFGFKNQEHKKIKAMHLYGKRKPGGLLAWRKAEKKYSRNFLIPHTILSIVELAPASYSGKRRVRVFPAWKSVV